MYIKEKKEKSQASTQKIWKKKKSQKKKSEKKTQRNK